MYRVTALLRITSLAHGPAKVPLDVEEYVGSAALNRLEVRLLDAAVVEVEPGLAVGGKCSVVT